jgi:hypothetical protein
MIVIFDLDHTVIDSSHRQLTRKDGTLDLDNWRANCTQDKIMADTLLPLANLFQQLVIDSYHEIVICTARCLGEYDLDFLRLNGLNAHVILSRPIGCMLGDADLKEMLLTEYALETARTWANFSSDAVIYDDNDQVLSRCSKLGIMTKNALKLNQKMGKKA